MRKLSTHIAGVAKRPLPARVTERAKHHLLDTLSAMLSGAPLLPGRRAIEYVGAMGGTPEACVVGTRIVTTVVNAALANGMLAHADETDDAYYLALVHPGCAVVPAALAMAICWAAAGFLEAEKAFRRLRGHKNIQAFIHALRQTILQYQKVA